MSYGTEDHKHNAYDVYGVVDEHHRHYDLENLIEGLREDLGRAQERIRELEDRCDALERQTPQARQAQYEADVAAADLAESGYDQCPPVGADRHGPGCGCPYCPEPEPDDYDPGPEVDDEGGMSEHRYAVLPAEEER